MSEMNQQIPEFFKGAETDLLRGVSMVEASAGTGKTYTIAMLVVRLIVEFDLPIEKILIVTFTKAATQELSDRIRKRLKETQRCILGEENSCDDETLLIWIQSLKDRKGAVEKITAALQDIDMAPVFTIHGFCQRALKEYALLAGSVPEVEVIPDLSTIKTEISEDFWRKIIYPLPGKICGAVIDSFPKPASLFYSVFPSSSYFTHIEPAFTPFEEAMESFNKTYIRLSTAWPKVRDELYERFTNLVIEGKLKKDISKGFESWWNGVNAYFSGTQDGFPLHLHWLQDKGFYDQIHGGKVRKQEKKDALVAEMALPDADITSLLESKEALILSLRCSFAMFLQKELQKRMENTGRISYDDIIYKLHSALLGANGQELRKQLKIQYGAALIDEFQDTDMQQWQIFSSIFAGKGHFLYLIGDPKQSIYRFRGADILSYFQARKSADRLLSLNTNYRSHPAMVHAVNTLFERRSKPFYYDENRMPFLAVDGADEKSHRFLVDEDGEYHPLICCQLHENAEKETGKWSGGETAVRVCGFIVAEIIRILNGGLQICEKSHDGTNKNIPLHPSDIAVLVRNNDHAEEYRNALAAAKVPAVVSSKHSVFISEEVHEVFLLMRAVLEPGDVQLLKNSMALPWFGCTANELLEIWDSMEKFTAFQERFASYLDDWRNGGVMLMLRHVIDKEAVYENLGKTGRAERKIANIVHLMEILQLTETENRYGPLQLLEWLQKKIENPPKEDELRLEKDEDAVNIVTMHGAKGLEYSIVFTPYLWHCRDEKKDGDSLVYFDRGEALLDLGSESFAIRQEKLHFETQAEDMRLLYVAITRAKLCCYLFWADVAGVAGKTADSFDSALGYLLFANQQIDFEGQIDMVKECVHLAGGKHLLFTGEEEQQPYQTGERQRLQLDARKNRRDKLDTSWQMTSYSALSTTSLHEETDMVSSSVSTEESASETLQFAELPSGAHFGNVVHDLFEEIAFADFLDPFKHLDAVGERCRKYGVDVDDDGVHLIARMLQQVVQTPIKPFSSDAKKPFFLADFQPQKCMKEMNFYFHLKKGQTGQINHILAGDRTVLPLLEKEIAGYLKGFIDLVFECDGVFYIADYKTNNLGDSLASYREDALIEAMASHNYGLQLWIYALVLHTYLQNTLPGYSYEQHFGGVYYFFVRGMKSGYGVYGNRPDLQRLEQLVECFGGRHAS